jgi:antitoxin component YwqK of YwqJK toxin-antitoxin module
MTDRLRAVLPVVVCVAMCAAACSDPETERIKRTTKPTYDQKTGRLTELTYDRNKNGVIDTWTEMDGARPVRSRIDTDEDGKIDRWEYYDEKGALVKVGFSRRNDGKPDAWAYAAPDGKLQRVDVSSTGDERKIDRWEHYEGGVLVRAEEDTNGDGRADKWETYEAGALETAAFDENGDGRPDRRLTYHGGQLVLIESAPDASGTFTHRVEVKP